jgi:hypothetical protein
MDGRDLIDVLCSEIFVLIGGAFLLGAGVASLVWWCCR